MAIITLRLNRNAVTGHQCVHSRNRVLSVRECLFSIANKALEIHVLLTDATRG